MSIDENLNKYQQAQKLLQDIIASGVQSKMSLIEMLKEDLEEG